MFALDADLKAKWYVVTTDADEAWKNGLLRDMPGPAVPEVCTSQLTVTGGDILGSGLPATWSCPPGTYYHNKEVCPICPVGYTCPGGAPLEADRIPCEPSEYPEVACLAVVLAAHVPQRLRCFLHNVHQRLHVPACVLHPCPS